jgi:hypothetical protein
MLLLVLLLLFLVLFVLKLEKFDNEFNKKIPCKKWEGDLRYSPDNICKDCGYPIDCHGPYVGESWRHIFKDSFD